MMAATKHGKYCTTKIEMTVAVSTTDFVAAAKEHRDHLIDALAAANAIVDGLERAAKGLG